jgi:hypothetical protein
MVIISNRWPTKIKFSPKHSLQKPLIKVHYNPLKYFWSWRKMRVNRRYNPITHPLYVLRAETRTIICKTGMSRFKDSMQVWHTVLTVITFLYSCSMLCQPKTDCDQRGKTKQMLLILYNNHHCAESTLSYSHPKTFHLWVFFFFFSWEKVTTRRDRTRVANNKLETNG